MGKLIIFKVREHLSRILYLIDCDYSSLKILANFLLRPTQKHSGIILFLLFGLAPSGVCKAIYITINTVSSYLHLFTLTINGGIFSVALSLRSPLLEIIQHFFPVESGLSSAKQQPHSSLINENRL